MEPAPLREELGLGPEAALLGQVAQITPWKGQDVAIRTLARAAQARRWTRTCVLVGEVAFGGKGVRYDNHAFLRSLEALVDELGVREAVHFLGQRDDVPEVLRALDLSLLPSWEEPFGLVDGREHGRGHAAAGEPGRRRPRAGRGRRHPGACCRRSDPEAWARAAVRAARATARRCSRMGAGRPAATAARFT